MKKIFSASIYDLSENYSKDQEWLRYSEAYIIAEDIESATKIVTKNVDDNSIVVSVREMVDAKLFM